VKQLKFLFDVCKIRYFTVEELTKGKSIPYEYIKNIMPTIAFTDKMRGSLMIPITINSSYRDEALNKEIGGVRNSLHLVFNALDISPVSGKLEDLNEMKEYVRINRTNQMGVGYYTTFIHLDFRGELGRKSPVTWKG